MTQKYRVLGLMSGTSIDAIDVALIETDGVGHVAPQGGEAFAYDKLFREQVRLAFGKKQGAEDPHVAWVEQELTKRHAYAVQSFLEHQNLTAKDIDLIGFHGQTLWHSPKDRQTVQIGDGPMLADLTGIDVVYDFRSADVKAGGQGAPLVPLYHQALARNLPEPLAIVNIGGVSNITWIGGAAESEILSFDMGPGNALLDDWMMTKTGKDCDRDGGLAAVGKVDAAHLVLFAHHPYFAKAVPKSLDRDAFMNFVPHSLANEDGAATLTMMTVQAIIDGLKLVPRPPQSLYITGGGRHNATMMRWIEEGTGLPVRSVEALGWNGDMLEAEAFAYLAVRSVLGLPLTLPTTTGVAKPMTGGRVVRKPL